MRFVDLRSDWKNNTLQKLVERQDYESIKITFIFYMFSCTVAGFGIAYSLIKGGYI